MRFHWGSNLDKWEKTRQKGAVRFILLYWGLGWGISVAVVSSLVNWATTSDFNIGVQLPIALVIFPLAGAFTGWLIWNGMERKSENRQ